MATGAISCLLFTGNSLAASERGTLHMAHFCEWNGKESFDPASPTRFFPAILMLYERLLRLDGENRIVPGLALSWKSDDTSRKFTFRLRDGVRFHNGRPFTAADVVYTFRHILDPKTESPAASALEIIDADAFETPDDLTVVFHLKNPHADFPLLLVHYMVRMIPRGSADTIGSTGIGTGPFRLETFDLNDTTVLAANDDYWGNPPGLARIHITGICDKDTQVYALLDGQIDYVNQISSVQAELFRENKEFTVQELLTGTWYGLMMNITRPPFTDLRIRQAMKLVVDRQKMIDLVARGHGALAYDHPVWPLDPYHLKLDSAPDVQKAASLIAEAGYPDGLDVRLDVADDPYMVLIAVAYKAMAASAGIRIEIRLTPSQTYWTDVVMNVPFFGTHWGERFADQILGEAFRSGAKWNETAWNNPAFDKLLDDARQEENPENRRALYHKAQRLLTEQGGAIIPFFEQEIRAFSADVQGILPGVKERDIDWATVSRTGP